MKALHSRIKHFYHGRTRDAEMFRYGLLAFDLVTVSFFVVSSMVPERSWMFAVDIFLGIFVTAEYFARLSIAPKKLRFVFSLVSFADWVVIVSLFLAAFLENLAFLRVLRALRLMRSYHLVHDLRSRSPYFRRNEEVIHSTINLVVFIFVTTALVYVLQVRINPDISNYVDALYFTVTTLTTTGFGDITLQGATGRMLSVLIMVLGVALFLRLLQTIFRPHKVRHVCAKCGLNRHDPDAVHCKHCGTVIAIETEGE